MKILYGIQGTGHGHLSRAREILPELSKVASVDVLMSGTNCKMTLEGQEVSQRRGLSLSYDSNGGVSYLRTALEINPIRFLRDIQSLNVEQYDLVISDFEPVSSWAAVKADIMCIGLSHQASFLSNRSPRPPVRSHLSENVLRHFAPCHKAIGFHFLKYDSFIEGPIIRSEIRNLSPYQGDHMTVYLPAFDPELLTSVFSGFTQVRWEIFSPACDFEQTTNNVTVRPVGNQPFLKSLESSIGVITSAGFETSAEAIFLGKKLMVVPIKNQYEQLCNAEALKKLGVPVAYGLDQTFTDSIHEMITGNQNIRIPEFANAAEVTQKILTLAESHDAAGDQHLMTERAYS